MRTLVLAVLIGVSLAPVGCSGLIGDSHLTPPEDDGGFDEEPLPDGCDIGVTLARNGCTQSGCHGRSYEGNLDLASPGLAERLVDVRSQTAACAGELLIDPAAPENSLILKATNPAAHATGTACTELMPMERDPMSADDLACLNAWVLSAVADWGGPPIAPFVATPPESYAAMVKTLLNGEVLTATEVADVTEDPANLRTLVSTWMESEGFAATLGEFLSNSLQSHLDTRRLQELFGARGNRVIRANGTKLVAAVNDSVVTTARDIIDEGRPFTEVVTTNRWYVNTALLTVIAYFDRTLAERTAVANRHTVTRGTTALPIATSVATKNWVFPQQPADCTVTTLTEEMLLQVFMGSLFCNPVINLNEANAPLKPTDFTDWRYVTFQTGTSSVPWYDVPKVRAATTWTVRNPRVGFFTQPAFLANWLTSDDNKYRVLINQTLIAALDATFSAADPTEALLGSQVDKDHAAPGTQCYGCHRLMDPMRGYFASTTATSYAYQNEPTPAAFAFFGKRRNGGGIEVFADSIATHPRFALAWTQKLCMFATAQRCDESDPEVKRVAAAFKDSDHDFKQLVVELFTSPIVTRAAPVQTFETAEPLISVMRRAQLCLLLKTRTGVPTICTNGSVSRALTQVSADSFARGEVDFVLASDTSSFHMAAAERLCNAVAPLAVTASSRFKPTDGAVIEKIVTDFMGLPVGHSRHDLSVIALEDHVAAAVAEGATNQDAVRSAFVAACMSTDIVALGM